MMRVVNFFKKKKRKKDRGRKLYFKSAVDLRLLPEQIIYVEGAYDRRINKVIGKRYDKISSKLRSSILSAEFVYLPFIAQQLQSPFSFFPILKYYFPNIKRRPVFHDVSAAYRTDVISSLLFSSLQYEGQIRPGFFRYVGRDSGDELVYEYFPLKSSNAFAVVNQIDYYIRSLFGAEEVDRQLAIAEKDAVLCDAIEEKACDDLPERQEPPLFGEMIESECAGIFSDNKGGLFDEKPLSEPCEKENTRHSKDIIASKRRKTRFNLSSRALFDESVAESEQLDSCKPLARFEEEKTLEKQPAVSEHELLIRIKSDIRNLKELGFYELLIKEIGSVLFDKNTNQLFQPSRLCMTNEFRIYLPDFSNMEIVMASLPKTLFVFFLRHPEGVNLKTLIDYKKELLEIYKLLSYRETFQNMVESVNRICNPLEGSINEKLSRIKEAFLRKMSIDTAKYYIVTGERGMKKRIEIDRSLIELPAAFEEIELTKVWE